MSVTRIFHGITRADIAGMQEEVICPGVLENGAKIRGLPRQIRGRYQLEMTNKTSTFCPRIRWGNLEIVPVILSLGRWHLGSLRCQLSANQKPVLRVIDQCKAGTVWMRWHVTRDRVTWWRCSVLRIPGIIKHSDNVFDIQERSWLLNWLI